MEKRKVRMYIPEQLRDSSRIDKRPGWMGSTFITLRGLIQAYRQNILLSRHILLSVLTDY